jgi:fumarylpyruvate hydrolase
MTRCGLQLAARAKQRPWDFEQAAVIAPIICATEFAVGEHLVWSVDEFVSHLSHYYHLALGDLIYTGTPAGVGAMLPGDAIRGTIDGAVPVELALGEPE